MNLYNLFCSGWILMLPVVGTIGVGFVAARRINKSLKRYNNSVGLVLLGFIVLPIPVLMGMFLYDYAIGLPQESQQILKDSDTIIKSLGTFKAATGHYPENLSELEPNYLNRVPTHPRSLYKYERAGDDFNLSYGVWYSDSWLGYLYCTYKSKEEKTHCRD